ncbi:NfeD family protein [Roseiarcaceae bacterium H3SJ34-1]|uniref:NfeD family protein n=1 Tax=Terripilifer ovatus TaxID=3032367 RepID=UPI003AB97150|nr:NfeD family protein [Roseiarcaceae bacterium H3SJ34-1]
MDNLGIHVSWLWLVAGVLLCAAEAVVPGMFLLWIGIAALATGLVLAVFAFSLPWTLVLFGILTIVSLLLGRKFYGSRDVEGDRPFLNRRADALVGRTFILTEAIRQGEGRINVDDSPWRVRGPDMPAGTKIKVTAVEDAMVLLVEQA